MDLDSVLNFCYIILPFEWKSRTEAVQPIVKIKFQEQTPCPFWLTVAVEHTVLVTEVMKVLLPFPKTYICDASFSAMTAMKTKFRS